ncbi:NADPH-dependent oxidoreductase [Leucobacter allii]|uniref:NADPH-dependent oxidoreductase n=1 Tax=Leucobacter allii TaxID=2932247 RepID=A0ABY4FLV4_9MICO|nr:NADPH-dependent oxidoreductase [Leucobacter allii]UOQ57266.1 NADPH-dependent oxidoreductase [Leucobacter allii]
MTERRDSAVIAQQLQHRSVRRYLDAPVSDAQLERIVHAAQRASTSSNLQVVSVVAVRDRERKRRISRAIGGRSYVEEAPVFLVWIADLARNAAVMRAGGAEPETLGLIENTLIGAVDVGIAAQNALLAAESLGLGGVFVGSVRNNPEAVSAELGLPRHAFPVVGMALGVPDPEEGTGVKPRLPLAGVLHRERYDDRAWRPAAEEYEADYERYFATQGTPGRSWARTVIGRLATAAGLHGRHTMRASLRAQGYDSE